jgi:hypothetical protein
VDCRGSGPHPRPSRDGGCLPSCLQEGCKAGLGPLPRPASSDEAATRGRAGLRGSGETVSHAGRSVSLGSAKRGFHG